MHTFRPCLCWWLLGEPRCSMWGGGSNRPTLQYCFPSDGEHYSKLLQEMLWVQVSALSTGIFRNTCASVPSWAFIAIEGLLSICFSTAA